MSPYFIQGKQIHLGKTDFKAQGGEGSIYVKGSTAYKIYSDPTRAIAEAKILELSVLTEPNIIRPLNVLLDSQQRPVGYSMRHVGRSYALCQLFPRAFRQRNNLTPEKTLGLVRRLQAGVSHIHTKGILVVDLNELNFLVAGDFSEVFFIDVDSYQTPSFPATVLMESVRDRHARGFTVGSDWFSFAIVSFQMFGGIHPYKGTYPPLQQVTDKDGKLAARMRANVSVLHKGVSVPSSTLPFSVIPPNYLDWYRAVLEEGKRVGPPNDVQATVVLSTPAVRHSAQSGVFLMTEIRELDADVIWYDNCLTVTEAGVYFDGRRYPKPPFDAKFVVTPRQRLLIAAYHDGTRLRFRNLTIDQEIAADVDGEEVMVSNRQLYLKQLENIFAVDFVEPPRNLLLTLRPVANVMMRSTRMFDGVAIQSLLGTTYLSLPVSSAACHQVRVPELDGYQILDARLYRNVLLVVVAKGGRYDKHFYRFAADFSSYDVRVIQDVTSTSINFTVLDSGLVLHLTDDDTLEVFSKTQNSMSVRSIQDQSLQGDVRLFHTGSQALIARERKLYKISLAP
jgi:hypothetical protein